MHSIILFINTDDCPEICTNQYNPVCGTDGETYSNKCELRKEACTNNQQLRIAHNGDCQQGKLF